MQVDLRGKNALVTGGSGDIGRAICTALARAGARIALTYFLDREGAERTATAVRTNDPEPGPETEPIIIRGNFSDTTSTDKVMDTVRKRLARVDIFVNNAASGVLRPIDELEARHWQWTLDVNARALFTLSRGLVAEPALMARGSRIIALSSLGATRAIPQYAVVGASKAAMESLARHLALELGPRGINVNVISPGIVDTRALTHFPNRDELLDVALRRTPVGRLVTPDDVAGVALFLCSHAAAMIHGQTIHVDGGYSVMA